MLRQAAAALISLALLITARSAHTENVRISYGGTSGYNVPLWVCQDAGLFKKYGLTADLILISGDAASLQAMLANELDFANAAGTTPIQATLQGADFVIIASSYNLMPYSLVVGQEIRAPVDLKGKKIAVSRLGGITEFAVRLAFEKFGLDPREATLVQSGPDAQRVAALQSGAVAATVLAPPGLFTATSLGLKVMADLGDLGIQYPSAVMVVRRAYLQKNRPTVKKFLMAFIDGLHLYARDKDYSIRVMQKYSRLSNQQALSRSHDYFIKNTALVPLTDPAAIKNALAERAAGHKLEEFYDNSIIQELVSEGFPERVAKGVK